MTEFFANFQNNTDRAWTFGLYQELPHSPGLDSVSWKQATVPQGGYIRVRWQMLFDVAIADYEQHGGIGVYTVSQILDADLGTSWDIVIQDNVQQLVAAGRAPQDNQILIHNRSELTANPGLGMSGQGSVYQRDVPSGTTARFMVTPVYYVALFNDLVPGEVIGDHAVVGPLQLTYPPGRNAATVTATLDDDTIGLHVSYGSQIQVGREVVDQRVSLRSRPTRQASSREGEDARGCKAQDESAPQVGVR